MATFQRLIKAAGGPGKLNAYFNHLHETGAKKYGFDWLAVNELIADTLRGFVPLDDLLIKVVCSKIAVAVCGFLAKRDAANTIIYTPLDPKTGRPYPADPQETAAIAAAAEKAVTNGPV